MDKEKELILAQLSSISIKMQKQIRDIKKSLDDITPIAETVGYTINRETGKLSIKNDSK